MNKKKMDTGLLNRSMNPLKITYWVSTSVFAALFATTGTLYLLHYPGFAKRTLDLHYPLYLLDIIGLAKVLGAVTLVVPRFNRLKEWAYAGFTFDFIGAIWSHFYVEGVNKYILIAIPFSVLMISYISLRRLQQKPATFIVR